MFLADFSKIPDEKEKKSMLGTAKNILIGKSIPGMLARVGTVGAIGATIHGRKKFMNNMKSISPLQREYYAKTANQNRINSIKKGLVTGGKIAGIGAGVTGVGAMGITAKKEYDKRNRKWWEIL